MTTILLAKKCRTAYQANIFFFFLNLIFRVQTLQKTCHLVNFCKCFMDLDIPKFLGCFHNLSLPLPTKEGDSEDYKTRTEFSCPKSERLSMKGAEEKGSKGPADPSLLLRRV